MTKIMKLESIRIQNMKNVEDGTISFLKNVTQEEIEGILNLIGIYGQNGSGKTAIVDALVIVQDLMRGKMVQNKGYIREGADNLEITLNFLGEFDEFNMSMEYYVSIGIQNKNIYLNKEKISASYKGENIKRNMKSLIEFGFGEGERYFGPSKRYEYYTNLTSDMEMERLVDLRLAKRETGKAILQLEGGDDNKGIKSFIFNEVSFKHLAKNKVDEEDLLPIVLENLSYYANTKVSIVEMNENFFTMTDTPRMILPIDLRQMGNDKSFYFKMNLEGENIVPTNMYHVIQDNINMINEVLESLIPECKLGIFDQKETLLDNGEEAVSFMITSIRNEKQIPLRCESAGIKKIIVLATKLIRYYNDSSYLLIIDEFDTGIFEYLLGEIIEVLSEGAKGQLLFTCHNLHSMELLEKEYVIFTTTNAKNRYLRPKNISKNKNLRLAYLASLAIGGQDENLYNDTDKQDFAMALEDAYLE